MFICLTRWMRERCLIKKRKNTDEYNILLFNVFLIYIYMIILDASKTYFSLEQISQVDKESLSLLNLQKCIVSLMRNPRLFLWLFCLLFKCIYRTSLHSIDTISDTGIHLIRFWILRWNITLLAWLCFHVYQ